MNQKFWTKQAKLITDTSAILDLSGVLGGEEGDASLSREMGEICFVFEDSECILRQPKFLNIIKKRIEYIFAKNNIAWLKGVSFYAETDNIPLKGSNLLNGYLSLLKSPVASNRTEAPFISYIHFSEIMYSNTLESTLIDASELLGFITAHELLHQYLMRISFLLFGQRFTALSPDGGGHFDQDEQGRTILNLNTDGNVIRRVSNLDFGALSSPPVYRQYASTKLYKDITTMHPIHQYYMRRYPNIIACDEHDLLKNTGGDRNAIPIFERRLNFLIENANNANNWVKYTNNSPYPLIRHQIQQIYDLRTFYTTD